MTSNQSMINEQPPGNPVLVLWRELGKLRHKMRYAEVSAPAPAAQRQAVRRLRGRAASGSAARRTRRPPGAEALRSSCRPSPSRRRSPRRARATAAAGARTHPAECVPAVKRSLASSSAATACRRSAIGKRRENDPTCRLQPGSRGGSLPARAYPERPGCDRGSRCRLARRRPT